MAESSFLLSLTQAFLLPLFSSALFTAALIFISKKLNMSVPQKKDRWHKRPVSNLGGIGIFLSFLIPFLLFQAKFKAPSSILLPLSLIFSLGLFDDFFNLKPHTKLFFQIAVAILIIHKGYFFSVIGTKFTDFSLSLIWIIVIINAFNLIDNIDGLLAGIALICGGSLLIFFMLQNNASEARLYTILCACLSGFLLFNFSPAKIFMGNSGSYFIGAFFSIMSIRVFPNDGIQIFPLNVFLFLIFFVPLFDTLFVFSRRIFSKKLVYQGGCDHISHTLVGFGLSEKKTVLLLYTVSLVCSTLALMIHFFF